MTITHCLFYPTYPRLRLRLVWLFFEEAALTRYYTPRYYTPVTHVYVYGWFGLVWFGLVYTLPEVLPTGPKGKPTREQF